MVLVIVAPVVRWNIRGAQQSGGWWRNEEWILRAGKDWEWLCFGEVLEIWTWKMCDFVLVRLYGAGT